MKLSEKFKTIISDKLKNNLSDKTKRMILLTSLYRLISNQPVMKKESLHKLNEVMKLSQEDDSLMFPAHLSSVIWRDGKAQKVICDSSGQCELALAEKIVDMIPNCLKYSTATQMLEGIKRLLELQPKTA